MSINCCRIVNAKYGQSFILFTQAGRVDALLKHPESFDIMGAADCGLQLKERENEI